MISKRISIPVFITILFLIGLFGIASAGTVPAKKVDAEAGTLMPGESRSYNGVTVTWEVRDADLPTSGGQPVPLGRLQFRGPTSKIENVETHLLIDAKGNTSGGHVDYIFACLGDVVFQGNFRAGAPRFEYQAFPEPGKYEFDGKKVEGRTLMLSSVRPLQLNQWKVTLSDKPVKMPGAGEHLQIIAKNQETNDTFIMPEVEGAQGKFGRFFAQIKSICDATRTARIEFMVDADPAIKGRDGLLPPQSSFKELRTFGAFLTSLSQSGGFTVEWVERPVGQPESVAYLKDHQFGLKAFVGEADYTIGNYMDWYLNYLNPSAAFFGFEWKDATHLRVWPTDYDKVLAEKEKQKQSELAQKEAEKALNAANGSVVEKWKKEYWPTTAIYALKNITPVTAKALIDPELQHYRLVRQVPNHVMILKDPQFQNSIKANTINENTSETAEACVADDKANAIVVTAIPGTQEKVKALLAKIDGGLAVQVKPAGVPQRYQLEVAILEGSKLGEGKSTGPVGVELSFPVTGRLKAPVLAGTRVKKGQAIAELDVEGQLALKREDNRKVAAELEMKSKNLQDTKELKTGASTEAQKASQARLEELHTKIWQLDQKASQEQAGIADLNSKIKQLDQEMARIKEGSILRSPMDGVITWVSPDAVVNKLINSGDSFVSILPVPAADAKATSSTAQAVAPAPYGIGKEDLKVFGFDRVVEIGKGVISLAGEKGEMGSAGGIADRGLQLRSGFSGCARSLPHREGGASGPERGKGGCRWRK